MYTRGQVVDFVENVCLQESICMFVFTGLCVHVFSVCF